MGSAGAKKVSSTLKKHNGRRFREGIRRAHKGIMKSLGRDELLKQINDATALIAQPGSAPALLQQRASLYFAAMRYPEALQDISAFLQHEPKNVVAQFTRGYINSLLENFDDADKDLNTALVRSRF